MLFHYTEIAYLQKPSITNINSKFQSNGPIYILQLLAFVEIRLFNDFSGKEKQDSDEKSGVCGMRDSREKGTGMQDQDPPSRPSTYSKHDPKNWHMFM